MKAITQGTNTPPDFTRLGLIGLVLKLLPWLVFIFESVRHTNYWESFSWLPGKLENTFVLIALAMILTGFAFGYLSVERYVVSYRRFKNGDGLKPRFRSLILGCVCLLTEPIGLLLFHLADTMRRQA